MIQLFKLSSGCGREQERPDKGGGGSNLRLNEENVVRYLGIAPVCITIPSEAMRRKIAIKNRYYVQGIIGSNQNLDQLELAQIRVTLKVRLAIPTCSV